MSSSKHFNKRNLPANSLPETESLESRLLLDGAPGDPGGFTTEITRRFSFADENDNQVTISVTNATAVLTTSEDGSGEILAIDVTPLNDRASLLISSRFDVEVDAINVYGSISNIKAPKVDLTGDMDIQGWAKNIVLSDIADSSQIDLLTDSGTVLDPKVTLSVTIDNAVNCDFSSGELPVKKFFADSFSGGSISAEYFGNIISKGDFTGTITAIDTDSKDVSIVKFSADSVTNTDINAPGAIKNIVAGLWDGGSISAGYFTNITSKGDFTGSITASGNDAKGVSIATFKADAVDTTDITAPGEIKNIKVDRWLNGSISADYLSNINSKGDFAASVTAGGSDTKGISLASFKADNVDSTDIIAPGAIKNIKALSWSNGSITAEYISNIKSKGDFDGTVTVTGSDSKGNSIGTFSAFLADNSIISAPQTIKTINVKDWTGGSITAGSVLNLIAGDRQNPADFTASISLDATGVADGKYTVSKIAITGQSRNTTWDIAGNVGTISAGDIDNLNIVNIEALKTFIASGVSELSLSVQDEIANFTAVNLDDSSIEASSAKNIQIKNDLTASSFDFSLPVQEKGYTVNNFKVAAEITDSTISSQGSINTFKAARMTDSSLLVGIDTAWTTDLNGDSVIDLVNDPASYNAPVDSTYAMINSLTINGARGITDNLLSNTNISAGAINKATLANIDTDNNGNGFYGVIFKDSLNKLTLKHNNRTYTFGRDNWPDTGWFLAADVDVNIAPKVTTDTAGTNEDTPVTTGDVLANDADFNGDTFDIVSFTDPANGNVIYNDDGTFTYTPDADYNGTDSFSYTIADEHGAETTGEVTITILPVNDAPTGGDDSYTMDEDGTLDITDVLDNDSDIDSESFTITGFSQASNGTVSRNGNTFTYTPDTDYAGTDSFTYTLEDDQGASSTATVTITIISDNDAPQAVDDEYSVDEDSSVTTGNVLENDTDAEGDSFELSSYTQTSHGTLSYNDDGTFDYTPEANFNGTDSFTYTIADTESQTTTATVTITVNPVNDDPVAEDDSDDTTTNTPKTTDNVLVNDSDIDGDLLTVLDVTQPANGTVIDNGDGTFTYTPDTDYTGTDTFTYTVTDSNGGTDTATVSIVVAEGPNNDPQAQSDSFVVTVNEDYTTTDVLANDTDADSDTLTITGFTQPANGSVVYNDDGTFTYSLSEENFFAGNDTFTYTVSDGRGGTDTGTIIINKPRITLDVLGAPELDGVSVDSLRVYRLRATGEMGESGFDAFAIDTINNIHNIWADDSTQTITSTMTGIDPDLSDFDTHLLNNDARLLENETNDGSNPSGSDFGTARAGMGSFMAHQVFFGYAQPQFLQIVVPTTASITISGTAYQGVETSPIDIDIDASEDPGDNNAPVATDDTFSNIVSNDDYTTTNVLANDTDADGNTLSITDFTQPDHGTVIYNDDGTFTYSLDEYFTGDDTFTYTISDGFGGTDTATVTINKPKITVDSLGAPVLDGVEVDSLRVYRLRATSLLGEDTFETFVINSLSGVHQIWADNSTETTHVTMTGIDADLSDFDTHLMFSPLFTLDAGETNDGTNPTGENFSGAYAGLGTFHIAEDIINSELSVEFFQIVLPSTSDINITGVASQGSNPIDIDITIEAAVQSGPNTAPSATDDSFSVPVNQDYTTTNVLSNDTDTDGDTLSITGFTQPANGTVVYNDDGTFTYSLSTENIFAGDDVFTYTLSDGNGGTDTGTITITKPPITLDVLGSPVLDGTEVDSLEVYRLRFTPAEGENGFEGIMIDNINNVHNIWADDSTPTVTDSMSGIDADLSDFDTHLFNSNEPVMLSNETNDGSNPSGNDFGTARAGLGSFSAEQIFWGIAQGQFFQVVLPSTESVTITGSVVQNGTEVPIDIDITATQNPANNAPSAADDESGKVYNNAAYTTPNVLSNDTDADDDTLSVSSFTQPTHGTVVYNNDGTFTYTLNEYFAGDDTFTYTISDGNGGTDTATFTITKPEITYEYLGSPSLGETEVAGLGVYRLRCTAPEGEDLIDVFEIYEIADTHQVWSGVAADTTRVDPGVLDSDWLDFDTHFLFSSVDSHLPIDVTETNDASNPSGLTFNNGTITGSAGMGTFITGAIVYLSASQSYEFLQVVVQNNDTVTVSGAFGQGMTGEGFDVTLE